MREMKLEFSIFAEPLADQLENQGFRFKSEKDEDRYEKLLHAWNLLRINGIQTDSESQKSGKRLMKVIQGSIEPLEVTENDYKRNVSFI